MKRIILFLFFSFIVFSQLSAAENTNEYENVTFGRQLFYPKNTKQEINFLNLNPLFYNLGMDFFPMSFYKNNIQNNNSKNSQNRPNSNIQENDVCGFIGSLFLWTGYYFAQSTMNRQEKEVYKNAWEQQQKEDRMRQDFINNISRYN